MVNLCCSGHLVCGLHPGRDDHQEATLQRGGPYPFCLPWHTPLMLSDCRRLSCYGICRHLSHYQIADIFYTVTLQTSLTLSDCSHLSHCQIAEIFHTIRLQTSLTLSDCRYLSHFQIADISQIIRLQTSLILSDCRHFLHYHIADISHTIRFRLNSMTVGQNKQLLWEQTDFDFTIGQCLAWEQRMVDSYSTPSQVSWCFEPSQLQRITSGLNGHSTLRHITLSSSGFEVCLSRNGPQ